MSFIVLRKACLPVDKGKDHFIGHFDTKSAAEACIIKESRESEDFYCQADFKIFEVHGID